MDYTKNEKEIEYEPINLDNSAIREWIKEFLSGYKNVDEYIKEEEGTLRNISLWILGSRDENEANMFKHNYEEHEYFLYILKKYKSVEDKVAYADKLRTELDYIKKKLNM